MALSNQYTYRLKTFLDKADHQKLAGRIFVMGDVSLAISAYLQGRVAEEISDPTLKAASENRMRTAIFQAGADLPLAIWGIKGKLPQAALTMFAAGSYAVSGALRAYVAYYYGDDSKVVSGISEAVSGAFVFLGYLQRLRNKPAKLLMNLGTSGSFVSSLSGKDPFQFGFALCRFVGNHYLNLKQKTLIPKAEFMNPRLRKTERMRQAIEE